VLRDDNRRYLRERGLVVYLRAPLELLANTNPRQRLAALMQEREPLYREAADLIIDTGNRTVRQVVSLIRQQCIPRPDSPN
jgi:shikimate kinase